ncbi:hypothetical protein MEO40_19150 [Dolichospermum sp. ST_sed1]|nr:hypothetical protein [Dolichospermum sp. ST_sed1]MDD1433279.1 hypothetical protein [Dolichospermum sp. ST_sed6]MDD1441938.1 hypothetical protein [Dolichospermum sp. ST_sed3]MDD1447375.1 hypothetical protein [Dolichospermum sp. ST_sed8]
MAYCISGGKMVPLHLENFKNNLHFTVVNALREFRVFILEKIRPEKTEIKKLIEKLETLPNVQAARAIRNKNDDSRKIVFEILANVNPSERIDLLTEATNLAVETEWKMDTLTKSRNWNLEVQVVRKFREDKKSQIIIFNNDRTKYLSPAS